MRVGSEASQGAAPKPTQNLSQAVRQTLREAQERAAAEQRFIQELQKTNQGEPTVGQPVSPRSQIRTPPIEPRDTGMGLMQRLFRAIQSTKEWFDELGSAPPVTPNNNSEQVEPCSNEYETCMA